MATAATTKVLWHRQNDHSENCRWPFAVFFIHLSTLITYLSENITTIDRFVIVIPFQVLLKLLNDPVYQFPQVHRIYVYYNENDNLQRNQRQLMNKYKKLRFWPEEKLDLLMQKFVVDNAINSPRSIDRSAIDNVVTSWQQTISSKTPHNNSQSSPEIQRITSTTSHGFSVKNIDQIDSMYICGACQLLLHEPYQFDCSHRSCQSCIEIENDQVRCSTCGEISSSKNVRRDRGCRNDMQQLPISCSVCDWSGSFGIYQKHLEQNHTTEECGDITTDVYTQQIDQINLQESVCTNETCDGILSDIISFSRSIYVSNNSNTIHDQNYMLYSELENMLQILSNHVNSLINDQGRIYREIHDNQSVLHTLRQNLTHLKSSLEEIVSHANAVKIMQQLLAQEIWSLKYLVNNSSPRSIDGTYIWKITNVQEKLADAQSERHRSILSPVFYTSPTGYKMCLRLYLNGDNTVRGTHLSLFLVIMKGDFDAILQWPFPYRVSFCLIDQSTLNGNQQNVVDSFWPDPNSDSFQRPTLNMNFGCGLKRFLSTSEFEEKQNLYIVNDTMFIEGKIDFFNVVSGSSLVPYRGESPDDDIHASTIMEDFMHMS